MEVNQIINVLDDINNLIENNYFTGDEIITINFEEKLNYHECNKNLIKNLRSYKLIKKNDELIKNECSCNICMSKFKEGEYKRILPKCKHVFHKKCIDKWLKDNTECPICRCNYDSYKY